MKRIFRLLTFALLIGSMSLTAMASQRLPGDVLGNVLNTDIRVFIDGRQIMGYNIDGWTYIVAEDLRAYGFVVMWSDMARSLTIARGHSTAVPRPVPDTVAPVGTVAFPYVYTDIVAYIGNGRVRSYNIQGYTVIRVDDLANAYGQLIWDDASREVHIRVLAEPMHIPTPLPPDPTATPGPVMTPLPETTPVPTTPAPTTTPDPIASPDPVATPVPDGPLSALEFEWRVFELVNTERARHGLLPLVWDEGLAVLARAHSRDMSTNDMFGHMGSDGLEPSERITRAGVAWSIVAENVFRGTVGPESAMDAWMGSPGHRANILNPELTHIGIGVYRAEGQRTMYYATQKFMLPR